MHTAMLGPANTAVQNRGVLGPGSQQRTGNAQQCRRHKALMQHTAASCFPSTINRSRREFHEPRCAFNACLESILLR
jgi:hypothetical protein